MRLTFAAITVSALLAACSGPIDRGRQVGAQAAGPAPSAPAAENYVWARNDGRRMSENPELLRQGQADQAACRASASGGGSLNMPAFISCMEARGYSRRPV